MKALRIVLVLGGVCAIFAAAYLEFPPVRLWALVVTGHSPNCPMANALQSQANVAEKTRIKDRILAGSHLLKQESGLELWDPQGPILDTAREPLRAAV